MLSENRGHAVKMVERPLKLAQDPAGKYTGGVDRWDWSTTDEVFGRIEAETGPFDLDGAADPWGFNAKVTPYCCMYPGHRFQETDVDGKNIYANFPFNQLPSCLDHVNHAHEREPSTACSAVVPYAPKATWWSKLEGWREIARYPAGSMIFTAPDKNDPAGRRFVRGTPYDIVVMRLDPADRPARSLAALRQHREHKFVLDSGASCHMTPDKHLLHDLQFGEYEEITGFNGATYTPHAKGVLKLITYEADEPMNVSFHDVLWVPDLPLTLISAGTLTARGGSVTIGKDKAEVRHHGEPALRAMKTSNMLYELTDFELELPNPKGSAMLTVVQPWYLDEDGRRDCDSVDGTGTVDGSTPDCRALPTLDQGKASGSTSHRR